MGDCWFALHVRPRFEKYAANQLSEKGYETFFPTYIRRRQWSDRVKTISLPLFPTYIFCRFDFHSRLPILVTTGLKSIVGAGKLPTPIDENEIVAIRHVMVSQVTARPWPYLSAGEMVRVEKGPLAGLTGIIVSMNGSDHLVISVTLLMRSFSVEIDRNWVKPVASGTKMESSPSR